MENPEGVLLTDPIEIQREAIRHYQKLFQDLPMDNSYVNYQIWKEKLCKMRLEIAAKNKTDKWTFEELEFGLKNLKNGTSRDPYGFSNELFNNILLVRSSNN